MKHARCAYLLAYLDVARPDRGAHVHHRRARIVPADVRAPGGRGDLARPQLAQVELEADGVHVRVVVRLDAPGQG